MAVAVPGAYRSISVAVAYLVVQAIAFGLGLDPAWTSAAGVLWIAVYCIAKAKEKPGEIGRGLDSALSSQTREASGA